MRVKFTCIDCGEESSGQKVRSQKPVRCTECVKKRVQEKFEESGG